jgi:hypothetical protein
MYLRNKVGNRDKFGLSIYKAREDDAAVCGLRRGGIGPTAGRGSREWLLLPLPRCLARFIGPSTVLFARSFINITAQTHIH